MSEFKKCPSCGYITKKCSACGSEIYDQIKNLIPVPQNKETLQQVNLVLLNAAAQREEQLLDLIRTLWSDLDKNNLNHELSQLHRNIIDLAMRT